MTSLADYAVLMGAILYIVVLTLLWGMFLVGVPLALFYGIWWLVRRVRR